MSKRVLITGASGFIGQAIIERFRAAGWTVRAASRRAEVKWPREIEAVQVRNTSEQKEWNNAVEGVDAVVHCAGRAHVLTEQSLDPLAEFRLANLTTTMALAKAAHEARVRRFVFISTIGVNGPETTARPFRPEDTPSPRSAYAQSKYEAEIALRDLGDRSGMEIVIIRPPLVYGPDAPGNFGRLLRAVRKRYPLPLGAIDNRRSLVALENLSSLVLTSTMHSRAANQTFLVSDGEDISTTDLLKRLAYSFNCRARLIPVPVAVLRGLGKLTGRDALVQQLCGSLQVDITKTCSMLGWKPPVSVDEGLRLARSAGNTARGVRTQFFNFGI